MTLYPPTPTLIEGFSLEDLFRNPEISEYMNDLKKALYFLCNPVITTTQKVSYWHVLTNRLKAVADTGNKLRREALKPEVTPLELAERNMLDNQLNRL